MTVPSDRRETQYLLMLDFAGALSQKRSLPDGTTERGALDAAKAVMDPEIPFGRPWRVEVFSREVPVEWTKVEEFRS